MKSLPDDDLFELLHTVLHALKRAKLAAAVRDDPDGPPPMAGRALTFFARYPGSTPSELAAHAGRDKAQVARLIKDLVAGGYLVSTPDPNDRRSHTLSLTERGRAVQKKTQAHRKRLAQTLAKGMTPAEVAQASALLRRMGENLDESEGYG